jgi:soluble lytic murein transglycosylase-like protein
MKQRPLIVWLAALGLGGMSCHVGAWKDAPAPAHVVVRPTAPASQEPAAPSGPADESLLAEQEILAELRSRHTALADHELVILARTIVEEAHAHGFDPALVMAVINVESGGYHLATSPVGALGLMQLLPRTGEELAGKLGLEWRGPATLFDPIVNVRLGTAYLRELTDRYDHVPTALAAYNWGPGRIDRRIRRGATVPSHYIEQVMKVYDRGGASAGSS